jgi:hypothetical protein
LLLIDVVRVVRAAVPFGFLAPLAGDVFSELKIARRADAVLGRAAALTAQETGIGCTGLSGLDVFDDNPMLPVVAKIIEITEPRCAGRRKCKWFGRRCIVDPPVPVEIVRNDNAVLAPRRA